MAEYSSIGGSPVALVERHLEFVLRRFKVDVRSGWVDVSALATLPHANVLIVQPGVEKERQLEDVAINLGFLALDLIRPIKKRSEFTEHDRHEFAKVLKWASELLIPEAAVIEAEQFSWSDQHLADECGTTLRMARVRIYWWKKRKGLRIVPDPEPAASPPPDYRKGVIPAVTRDPEERKRLIKELHKNWGPKQG